LEISRAYSTLFGGIFVEKIRNFFIGTFAYNHWEIRRKPSKKLLKFAQKTRDF